MDDVLLSTGVCENSFDGGRSGDDDTLVVVRDGGVVDAV